MGNTVSGGYDWEAGWRILKDNFLLKRSTAFVLLFLGLFLLVFAGLDARQGYDTLSWPMTNGTVVRSAIKQDLHFDRYRWLGKKYYPDIQYNYSVNGRQYSSNKISVSDWFITRNLNEVEKITATYSLSDNISVYYDSNNPDQALLETGIPERVIWALVGGGVTVILAIVLLVAIFKNNQRKKVNK